MRSVAEFILAVRAARRSARLVEVAQPIKASLTIDAVWAIWIPPRAAILKRVHVKAVLYYFAVQVGVECR
jgi:hypothetical protein